MEDESYDELSVLTETSHSEGFPTDSEDEGGESQDDDVEEVWLSLTNQQSRTASKRQKAYVRELYEAYETTDGAGSSKEDEPKAGATRREKSRRGAQPPRYVRKPGPFRVLELCTWTAMVTMMAISMGWQGLEPITLPRWDLFKASGRREAEAYLRRSDPDLVVCAWPCSPWSQMQRTNRRTPRQRSKLAKTREKHRRSILTFVHLVVKHQRMKRRCCLGENPKSSDAWQEPAIAKAFEGYPECVTHACVWNKRRPDNHILIKKPTKCKGDQEIINELNHQCDGSHTHSVVEGQMRIPTEQGWRSSSVLMGWRLYGGVCQSHYSRSRELP